MANRNCSRGENIALEAAGDNRFCADTREQVARLRLVVEALAGATQAHAEAVRSLADAIQALTARQSRP